MKVPNKFAYQIMKGRYGASNLLYYVHGSKFMDDLNRVAQCSKWYEISDMVWLLRKIQIHQQIRVLF